MASIQGGEVNPTFSREACQSIWKHILKSPQQMMYLFPWEQKENDYGSFFSSQCLYIYNQEGLIGFRSCVSSHLLLMASRGTVLHRILSHIQVQQGKVLWLISDTCHKYQRRWHWQRRQSLLVLWQVFSLLIGANRPQTLLSYCLRCTSWRLRWTQ